MSQRHIEGLDGLRALAAVAVFFVHFNQQVRLELTIGPFDLARLFANGEYGVSLFFTLSGFLISLPYWRALNSNQSLPSFYKYLMLRFARILPGYYFLLTLLVFISGIWQFPQMYADIGLHYLFLFNYAEFSIFSINAPFWSIAVEIQFYLLMPLIFILLQKVKRAWQCYFLFFLASLFYLIHYLIVDGVNQMIFWPYNTFLIWLRPYGAVLSHSLIAHLPHFLIGLMLAYLFLYDEQKYKTGRAWRSVHFDLIFSCTFILLFVFSGTSLNDVIQIPYGRYGLPMLPVLMAILIYSGPRSLYIKKALDGFLLAFVGRVSYGFYLYHLPVLVFVDRSMASYGLDAVQHVYLYCLTSFLLTVLMASISYYLLEKPVLTRVHRWG